MKTPETVHQPSNQHLWQTFTMEDFMKTQTASKLTNKLWLILVTVVILLLGACSQQPTPQATEGLEAQFGTIAFDAAYDAAGNSTGIYVVGSSNGSLAGPNQGSSDAYIRKYSFSGNVLWQNQFGTSNSDGAGKIAIQGDKIYVLGSTSGSLNGNLGGSDIFLRQYNDSGSIVWTRQFGTAAHDLATDVATDSAGNAIVLGDKVGGLGFTIRKVTPAGVVSTLATWSPFLLITDYTPRAVATDSANNIYVLADSYSNSSKTQIFKFNSSGLYLGGTLTKGLNEEALDITVSGDHIFVVLKVDGSTVIKKFPTAFNQATLPLAVVTPDPTLGLVAMKASGGDLYLAGIASAAKYSANLVKQWEKKISNSSLVFSYGLAVSSASNAVYPVGINATPTPDDAFITKVDMTTAAVAWTK